MNNKTIIVETKKNGKPVETRHVAAPHTGKSSRNNAIPQSVHKFFNRYHSGPVFKHTRP